MIEILIWSIQPAYIIMWMANYVEVNSFLVIWKFLLLSSILKIFWVLWKFLWFHFIWILKKFDIPSQDVSLFTWKGAFLLLVFRCQMQILRKILSCLRLFEWSPQISRQFRRCQWSLLIFHLCSLLFRISECLIVWYLLINRYCLFIFFGNVI